MGLFGSDKKKSGEQLRTLSEKEIQDKLYGPFRSSATVVKDDYAVNLHPAPSKSSASVIAPSVESRDLFKSSLPKPEAVSPSPILSRPDSSEKKRENTSPARFSPDNAADSKAFSSRARVEPRVKSEVRHGGPSPLANIGKAIGHVLRIIGNGLFSALRAVIHVIAKAFSAVDFRSARVRTMAYWTVGLCVLGGLFFSIHNLNAKREVAMKAPRKKVEVPAFFGFKKKAGKPVEAPSTSSVDMASPLTPVAPVADGGTVASTTSNAPLSEPKSKAVGRGSHVIQVATFATEEDARRLAAKIKESGMTSFVKPLTRSSGKVYYCVFIGRFASSQEAETQLEQFKKKEASRSFQDAFVRTLD